MLESRGFLIVFYALETAFIAAALVGFWRTTGETRSAWAELARIIRDDLFTTPAAVRGRLSALTTWVRGLGRLYSCRRYRAFYGVSEGDVPCVICGASTTEGHRLECRNRGGSIHPECVPAIVRRRGRYAVVRWLHTGQLETGEP